MFNLMKYVPQVWADEDSNDDWICVQTLDEPNKYCVLAFVFL